MDNQTELINLVNENMKRFGIHNVSTNKVHEQLIKIEEYFQTLIIEQFKLQEEIKKISKISITSVSNGSNVPRSQINLHQHRNTLKKYIEERIKDIETQDILQFHKFKKQKQKAKDLTILIDNLKLQVVDNLELKLIIEEQKKTIESLTLENQQYLKDIHKHKQEISKLKEQLRKIDSNKVVSFSDRSKN